jgi:hypothetical protein
MDGVSCTEYTPHSMTALSSGLQTTLLRRLKRRQEDPHTATVPTAPGDVKTGCAAEGHCQLLGDDANSKAAFERLLESLQRGGAPSAARWRPPLAYTSVFWRYATTVCSPCSTPPARKLVASGSCCRDASMACMSEVLASPWSTTRRTTRRALTAPAVAFAWA